MPTWVELESRRHALFAPLCGRGECHARCYATFRLVPVAIPRLTLAGYVGMPPPVAYARCRHHTRQPVGRYLSARHAPRRVGGGDARRQHYEAYYVQHNSCREAASATQRTLCRPPARTSVGRRAAMPTRTCRYATPQDGVDRNTRSAPRATCCAGFGSIKIRHDGSAAVHVADAHASFMIWR